MAHKLDMILQASKGSQYLQLCKPWLFPWKHQKILKLKVILSATSEDVTHVVESGTRITKQPATNSQDDRRACWRLYLNDTSLHKCSLKPLGNIQYESRIQYQNCYSYNLYALLIHNPVRR
ncbi:hypothetical protein A0J61_06648 [Choanephora cucurbitarum]|uniref:Uncharacterized protein n=1 Tax=Choanephora cucurbitarum TaxID=101091 RepID=A0A1C7N8A5_9FUNG|nr:hypothetical protein A0J61_06648 [Choanephora cucurbitarum]